MINIPSDILATPVKDENNLSKTLRDLVIETVEEPIIKYQYDIKNDVIHSFVIETNNNKYSFVSGSFYDVFVKL